MDDHDADFDTTRGTFAESHALEGEIVSVGPLHRLVAPEDGDRPRPRRTADAELREAVARLTECQARTLDALANFCGLLGALPPTDHARYRERLGRALVKFEELLHQARAVLLGGKGAS